MIKICDMEDNCLSKMFILQIKTTCITAVEVTCYLKINKILNTRKGSRADGGESCKMLKQSRWGERLKKKDHSTTDFL